MTAAFLPPALERGRVWGFALNLYTLRSQNNWGIGDFTDLRHFVELAGALGANVVGLNPLHALHYSEPSAASPYSPSSRYFVNPMYVDVAAVPEFRSGLERAARLRARIASTQFGGVLRALRDTDFVDYAAVAGAKWPALEELYEIFYAGSERRRAAFRAFVRDGGERLERFALHETLAERFVSEGRQCWETWPAGYGAAENAAVSEFATAHRRRIDYFKFLQFVADEQLRRVRRAARSLQIGLYRDLAVGADRAGADVWSERDAYVLDAAIGAPPDALGPDGQNWGLPPLDPNLMLRAGGANFTDLLQANMRHAGALRLDHVMSLARLFHVPWAQPPSAGAYVAYPFEPLLALAAAASRQSQCVLIGEDLGTVPDGFRERMERERILSYRLLLFERDRSGAFRPPQEYPRFSLATATTHDLPTLTGWVTGRDVTVREQLRQISADEANAGRNNRRVDVSHLLQALLDQGELDEPSFGRLHHELDSGSAKPAAYEPLVAAVYRFLARCPARIVLVALDDVLGERDQVNLPGTIDEYPNWRRKLSVGLETFATDNRFARLAREMRERVTPQPE